MQDDLFNQCNIIDDIKYLILLQLDEEEIHWIMSNVNSEWNSLCKSTFNDNRFHYKFIKYFEKLPKLDMNEYAEKPEERPEILVECLWDRLWTKGTIVTASSKGITVEIKTHIFNPFDKNNLINDPKNATTTLNTITYSQISNGDNPLPWFEDGYHHIAPLNTIDKYRTVKPSIHNHLSKIITSYKTDNNDNVNVDGGTTSENLDGTDDLNLNFSDPRAPRDKFNRLLIDILGYHSTKRHVLLCYNNSVGLQSTQLLTYQTDGYICGIIDVNALDLYFPHWNDDSDRFYQIPVIFDVTSRLFNEKKEPKTIEIDKNDDTVLVYQNVFKYGKNRYFTRIWIHPNDTHLYRPFGTDPTTHFIPRLLLATPVLNKQNTDDYNVKNYDFIKDNKLTVKQIFDEYIIEIENEEELAMFKTLNKDDKSHNFQQHVRQNGKYCNKIIQIAVLSNCMTDVLILHYKNKHKTKYQFDQVTENCAYLSDVDYKSFYAPDTNFDDFESMDCYQSNSLHLRPIINFDMYSLIQQFENFGKLPYYTQERIKLVERCLFKTNAFVKAIDDSEKIQKAMNDNCFVYYFVYIKPTPIRFVQRFDFMKLDDKTKSQFWDYKKWGNETKRKYGNELSFGRDDTYSIPINEWKLGIIIDWKIHKTKHEFINYLYNFTGQTQVFLDFTNEFDEFQQSLKKDWVMAHKKNVVNHDQSQQDINHESDSDWDDRKYFTIYDDILIDSKKKNNMNKVFMQYFVHLDDTNQIKPLF